MKLVINSIHNDIVGSIHVGQALALCAVANIGGVEFGEALTADVQKLVRLPNKDAPSYISAAGVEYTQYWSHQVHITKKATLCLLRLFRVSPENLVLDEWPERMYRLLESDDFGIITSAMSLVTAFASYDPHLFQICVPAVLSILEKVALRRQVSDGYKYYKVAAPWIQVPLSTGSASPHSS